MSARAKIVLLLGLIAAGALFSRTAGADRFDLPTLLATMRSLGATWAAIPLYFLLFGVVTTSLLPAVAMMITAGVTWGFWPGWLVVWAAANVWANAHFLLGRWMAKDTLGAWLSRRGASWLVRELDQGAVFTTVMIRQIPIPFLLVNLSGGASPMRWSQWALGNAIGLVPNCLIYTQLAAALADGVEGARDAAAIRGITGAAGVIALTFLSRWLMRRFVSAPRTTPAA